MTQPRQPRRSSAISVRPPASRLLVGSSSSRISGASWSMRARARRARCPPLSVPKGCGGRSRPARRGSACPSTGPPATSPPRSRPRRCLRRAADGRCKAADAGKASGNPQCLRYAAARLPDLQPDLLPHPADGSGTRDGACARLDRACQQPQKRGFATTVAPGKAGPPPKFRVISENNTNAR